MPPPTTQLTKADYETLAAFRGALRRFQRFSHDEARSAGLTAQQHQALLALKGFPGREYASIGEVAAQLHIRHHSAVGLIDRLVKRKLVRRSPSSADGRKMEVHLTAKGENVIGRLSAAHLGELRQLKPELHRLLEIIS